jgi:diguanylate cyclase (GGDEF)-like protein
MSIKRGGGIMHFILSNLDFLGIFILFLTILPIKRLMSELPMGDLRKQWSFLLGLIVFFIGSYIYIAFKFRTGSSLHDREIICVLLFTGALFVYMVSKLSLQTALDVKRIYTLEIENITDPLMCIKNRRYLDRKLDEEFSKAKRYELPLSVMMIDIDHFKNVNDIYGHDIGDVVLKNIGALIAKSIRESDCAARYGGEEIVVVFPMTDAQHAFKMAERLRKEIAVSMMLPADLEKNIQELYVTVSIGVAGITPETLTVDQLMKKADIAMYRAKNDGRNKTFLCDGSTPESVLMKEFS